MSPRVFERLQNAGIVPQYNHAPSYYCRPSKMATFKVKLSLTAFNVKRAIGIKLERLAKKLRGAFTRTRARRNTGAAFGMS